jgi:hypothetical protein
MGPRELAQSVGFFANESLTNTTFRVGENGDSRGSGRTRKAFCSALWTIYGTEAR